MDNFSLTFVAADPPIPPQGGGTRSFHFLRALGEVAICNLFVLFPIRKNDVTAYLPKSCKSIECSKTTFTSKSNVRINRFLTDLRLLLFPWSFAKEKVILSAGYFITNVYEGENSIRKVYLYFLRHSLSRYVSFLYSRGYSLPAKTLERLKQFRELEPIITKAIESSGTLWVDFSYLLPFFKNVHKKQRSQKIICNAHNLEYKILEQLQHSSKNNLERKWYKSQAAIMKKEELKGFSGCDLIITCSEEDRNEIKNQLPSTNVEIVPNGVDMNYFVPQINLTKEPSLLFTGTMGYAPNKDAVETFIEKILPLVIQTHPLCTFIIAGANAAQVLKKYTGKKNIEIISSPDDIRPYYNKAWVVVVPLLSGSGTRLKILEAIAMEKPVVSTAIGAEGLAITDSVHLLIADKEKEFADKINALIENKELRNRLSNAAKKRIGELYDWEAIEDMTRKKILQLI